jgi:hypothetical protein
VSVEVPLPPNGILNYRSVNIPIGVTVTFKRNAANTPVVMLVQGDVVIAGSIDISGKNSAMMDPDGDGNLFDDGVPGIGGPGGYDGGYGGVPSGQTSRRLGPGSGSRNGRHPLLLATWRVSKFWNAGNVKRWVGLATVC